MSDAVTISSAAPERTSMDYAALREGGMALIRKWASGSWTDHNVHDPGITVLEACSYAMTELGLRLQLDMADLLRSGEANALADLPPADRVLPVGPVNRQDLRSVLLDHPLVSDAQIYLPADSEVPFYEAAGDPPFTYKPGTPLVRPGGLYEVLVEFADRPLNSNTYSFQVSAGGQPCDIDVALPYWDEPEAAPFRQGVVVNTVAMVLDAGQAWRALPEAQSYFGSLDVAYTGPAGPGTVRSWVLLRITTVLDQPSLVVPGILAAARTTLESTGASSPLVAFTTRVHNAAVAVDQLRGYVAGWRNLGEQAVRIGVARVQEIAVRARVEVTGGIDVEQLLAAIFAQVERKLSPLVRFESLADRRRTQADTDLIYDGPLLRNSFLGLDSLVAAPPAVLYVSDMLHLIMLQRGGAATDLVTQENPVGRDIVAVTDLALANFINNRPITEDAEDCLHLVEVERYRPRLSIAKSHIVAVRNDEEVRYDLARVETLFADLLMLAAAGSRTTDTSPVWPVPRGELVPVEEYTPLQEELPANYAVGRSVLPDSATPERKAAAKQLQGYLFLFEQFLADTTAQLGNINRFFSPDAAEDTSSFTRPPFDLPGASRLLKRFPSGGDWPAFVADPDNPVTRALHDAAESRGQMLDRRSRMLDHLLARQGEEAVALGQELHRWARLELAAFNISPALLPARIAERRESANARLIRIKAALLREAPHLNAFRLLAQGHPFHGDATILRIEPAPGGFRWHLALRGTERLRSVDAFPTTAAAAIAAENALLFAGRALFYVVVTNGVQRRLRVQDGTAASALVVAESTLTWNSAAAANTALTQTAADFAGLRVEASLAPMERRIAYLTGMRSPQRRHLVVASTLYFQIVNDPPGGPLFGKRWRLWERPGNAGAVLLDGPVRFEATSDAAAVALAQQSIQQVLRQGLDEWNYRVVVAVGTTFSYELRDAAGTLLAVRTAALPSRAEAQKALEATIDHLYRNYGGEGFFLIEHLLLRPRQDGDTFLSFPVSDTLRERDPYSQRISLVFPSGYARDFSLPHATAPTTPVTPHRFRDPEFRRHAERMVAPACPAHLAPSIYWVDRQLAGSPVSAASLDMLDQRYFAWLDTVLIPGAAAAVIDAARAAMVEALNAIAHDAL
jgi:hypothetical protein